MVTYFFRPKFKNIPIKKMKDLKNRHLCWVWQASEKDLEEEDIIQQCMDMKLKG